MITVGWLSFIGDFLYAIVVGWPNQSDNEEEVTVNPYKERHDRLEQEQQEREQKELDAHHEKIMKRIRRGQ